MDKIVELLGIPGTVVAGIAILWAVLQLVGEICSLKGKIVPEFMNIRRLIKRRKEEKEQHQKQLDNIQDQLDTIISFYSPDSLKKRDKWMKDVDDRLDKHDTVLEDIISLKDLVDTNTELTIDLYINTCRHRIIDFAGKVTTDMVLSREEFNRIFKVHKEYEDMLEKHGKTNGEVDVAYRVITEAYQEKLKNHTFLEDLRGY